MRLPLLAAAAAALLAPGLARPCSVCAAGDPLVAASDAASVHGQVRLALETEWLSSSAGSSSAAHEDLGQATLRLVGVWSPVDSVNLVAQVPLVRKVLRMTDSMGMRESSTETGLGDVEIGARWFVLQRTSFELVRYQGLALSAGTSLPTGPTGARDGTGVLLDQHAQLGTGGFGPYAGVLYRFEQSAWHAFASVTGRVRTENDQGYRYGSSLHWSVQGQRQLGDRFALGLGVDGRWAAADRQDGAAVPDTGGLVLAVAPAANVEVVKGLWLSVRAQIPFATRLDGVQSVGPTVIAGLQYALF